MNERLRGYLDHILYDVPMTGKALELKEELLGNMQERFEDLKGEGRTDDEALRATIDAMGDIPSLFSEFKEPVRSPEASLAPTAAERNRSSTGEHTQDGQGTNYGNRAYQRGSQSAPRRSSRGCLTTFVVVAACLLLSIGGRVAFGSISGFKNIGFGVQEAKLVNTQEIDMADAGNIEVFYDRNPMDIVFYQGTTDKLVIKEYMFRDPSKDELAMVTVSDVVTVKSGRRGNNFIVLMGTMIGSERIELYLPKQYAGGIKATASSGDVKFEDAYKTDQLVEMSTTSGDIGIPDMTAEEIHLSASSGDIKVQYASGKCNVKTTSGDIKVSGGEGDSKFKASSGSIRVENLKGAVEASASSGEIKLKEVEGNGTIQTSSGDVTVEEWSGAGSVTCSSGDVRLVMEQLTGDLFVNTTSGEVKIHIPKNPGFAFQASATSGDINTNFDDSLKFNKKGNEAEGQVGESSALRIQVNTSSGDTGVTAK